MSYYRRGADNGLPLGLLMALGMVLMAWSTAGEAAGLSPTRRMGTLALIALILVPVSSWAQLRHSYRTAEVTPTWADLWTQGVTAFGCGSLIMGLAMYAYMQWVHPTYITDLVQMAGRYYGELGTAEGLEWQRRLEAVTQQGLLPSPIMLSVQLMLLCTFVGSIWAMLMAGLIKLVNRQR